MPYTTWTLIPQTYVNLGLEPGLMVSITGPGLRLFPHDLSLDVRNFRGSLFLRLMRGETVTVRLVDDPEESTSR